jgi:anti-sigma regulatory factor (Ser/Thr protein kinase)/putative methionine-R-sulfoxide reductase with GAF domain
VHTLQRWHIGRTWRKNGLQMTRRPAEERLRALQQVTDAALSDLPLEQMLGELMSRLAQLLAVDTAAVLLLDEDGRTLVARAAKGLEEEVERQFRVPVGRGFAGRVARERRPVRIPDVQPADVVNPVFREAGVKSLLGVPLLLEGRLLGVMHVGSKVPREFDDDEVELLQLAGDRVALAIGGRLTERERGLADAFQRSLMPPLPSLPGMSLGGRYMPAAATRLGGDWYDAFVLPSGMIGVAIGDVVGQGFHAAALMGQLRSALRAYALDRRSPKEVLLKLNALLRQLEPGWGAAVLYAIFDPSSGHTTMASAGQLPPLILDRGESSRFVELPGSAPLGSVKRPEYEEVRAEVPPGSLLVLFTDGLVERVGEGLDSGLARLQRALVGAPKDPGALCGRAIDALLPDGPGGDDVAMLAIGVTPFADPLVLRLPADPDTMPFLRRVLARWLDEVGASEQEVKEIALATAEACANAVEHAYSPASAEFVVRATRSAPGEILVTVSDQGQWRAPRGTDRGRGLQLMEALMDSVEVDRQHHGTAVMLGRRLDRAA